MFRGGRVGFYVTHGNSRPAGPRPLVDDDVDLGLQVDRHPRLFVHSADLDVHLPEWGLDRGGAVTPGDGGGGASHEPAPSDHDTPAGARTAVAVAEGDGECARQQHPVFEGGPVRHEGVLCRGGVRMVRPVYKLHHPAGRCQRLVDAKLRTRSPALSNGQFVVPPGQGLQLPALLHAPPQVRRDARNPVPHPGKRPDDDPEGVHVPTQPDLRQPQVESPLAHFPVLGQGLSGKGRRRR